MKCPVWHNGLTLLARDGAPPSRGHSLLMSNERSPMYAPEGICLIHPH